MIINNECARELVKEAFKLGINENMVLNDFLDNHKEFLESEVIRAAYYLNRVDILIVNGAKYYDDNLELDKYTKIRMSFRYRDYVPYSLLDDEVWEDVKRTVDIRKYNFTMLLDMLTKKSVLELNEKFGIPNDLVVRIN